MARFYVFLASDASSYMTGASTWLHSPLNHELDLTEACIQMWSLTGESPYLDLAPSRFDSERLRPIREHVQKLQDEREHG